MNKPKVIVTRKWPAEVEAQLKALYDVQLNESDISMSADELKQALYVRINGFYHQAGCIA